MHNIESEDHRLFHQRLFLDLLLNYLRRENGISRHGENKRQTMEHNG